MCSTPLSTHWPNTVYWLWSCCIICEDQQERPIPLALLSHWLPHLPRPTAHLYGRISYWLTLHSNKINRKCYTRPYEHTFLNITLSKYVFGDVFRNMSDMMTMWQWWITDWWLFCRSLVLSCRITDGWNMDTEYNIILLTGILLTLLATHQVQGRSRAVGDR